MKTGTLKSIIQDSGKTQVEVAEKIGVSPQMFNWMVKHSKKIRYEQIEQIAKVLKKTPAFLIRYL